MPYKTDIADHWYHFCPGSMIVDYERDQLAGLLSNIFGEYLVQLGGPSDLSLVKSSPINQKIYLGPDNIANQKSTKIETDLIDLPLSPNSVDVLLLSHILEYVDKPSSLLHEAQQALVPNGQLIILGFNCWSLLGATHLAKDKHKFPWNGKFWSMGHIKRWLRALGLRIVVSRSFYFRPLLEDKKKAKKLLSMEPIGQLCFPWFGNVYMITAQKRVPGMTPLKVSWWQKKIAAANGYVEPTTRKAHERKNTC